MTTREISDEVLDLHRRILYPSVRVRASKALGSGTVIYCKPEDPEKYPDEYETLVLTNHHVIADLIEVKEDWDSTRQVKRYRESRTSAVVEFMEYKQHSRVVSKNGKEARIVAWDDKLDLALLRLETVAHFDHIAAIASKERFERGVYAFDWVYTVGAAMGEDPVITRGQLAGFGRQIDGEPYTLSTAPSIFGNSGGAVYLEETREFIGVPARIAVQGFGSAVTHLSYSIPITTVYKFLEEKGFEYVYDPRFNSKQCAATREAKRVAAERRGEAPPDPNDPTKTSSAPPWGAPDDDSDRDAAHRPPEW